MGWKLRQCVPLRGSPLHIPASFSRSTEHLCWWNKVCWNRAYSINRWNKVWNSLTVIISAWDFNLSTIFNSKKTFCPSLATARTRTTTQSRAVFLLSCPAQTCQYALVCFWNFSMSVPRALISGLGGSYCQKSQGKQMDLNAQDYSTGPPQTDRSPYLSMHPSMNCFSACSKCDAENYAAGALLRWEPITFFFVSCLSF